MTLARVVQPTNMQITVNSFINKKDSIYSQFMIRRLAAAKQRSCYIEIFKLIVEHKVPYTVNRNGVFFNLSPLSDELVRQIDEILKRCEQRKQNSTN